MNEIINKMVYANSAYNQNEITIQLIKRRIHHYHSLENEYLFTTKESLIERLVYREQIKKRLANYIKNKALQLL